MTAKKLPNGNVNRVYAALIDENINKAEELATKQISRKVYNTPEKYGDKFNQVFHYEMDRLCFEQGLRKTTRFM